MVQSEDELQFGPFESQEDRLRVNTILEHLPTARHIFGLSYKKERLIGHALFNLNSLSSDTTFYKLLWEFCDTYSRTPNMRAKYIDRGLAYVTVKRLRMRRENLVETVSALGYLPFDVTLLVTDFVLKLVRRHSWSENRIDRRSTIEEIIACIPGIISAPIIYSGNYVVRPRSKHAALTEPALDALRSFIEEACAGGDASLKELFAANIEVAFKAAMRGITVDDFEMPSFYEIGMRPGVFLERVLQELPESVPSVAQQRGTTKGQLYRIINGHSGISADMALKLDGLGGVPAAYWCYVQSAYDMALARPKTQQATPFYKTLPKSNPS